MPRNYKKRIISLACLPLLVVAIIPSGVFAVGQQGNSAKTSAFCNNIDTSSLSVLDRFTKRYNNIYEAWGGQDENLSAKWTTLDQEVSSDRTSADEKRKASFEKMNAKATTDEQKNAVIAYREAVEGAVGARRTRYDSARQTFRIGVQSAIKVRRNTILAEMDAFEASMQSAIDVAKVSCQNDPSKGITTKATYQASMKLARDTYKNSRSADDTVGSQVRQLVAVRNATFKDADTVFQDSLKEAQDSLKSVFGSDSSI